MAKLFLTLGVNIDHVCRMCAECPLDVYGLNSPYKDSSFQDWLTQSPFPFVCNNPASLFNCI